MADVLKKESRASEQPISIQAGVQEYKHIREREREQLLVAI